MGRAVETRGAVMALLLPLASAAFDYQNALDEDIATYILVAIAAVYFSTTAVLLILAVCCCCKKAGTSKAKTKPYPDSNFKKPLAIKNPLPTIHEDEEPFSQQHHKVASSHRRVTRLRSDQEELLTSDEETSLPPSPTETSVIPPPQPPPPQAVRQNPDPRKKKTPQPTGGQPTPPIPREGTRLPGAASPLEKTPETQRKEVPQSKLTAGELPPLRNTPPVQRKPTGPEAAVAYDYYSPKRAPIQRTPNKRLESPQMQQRKKLTTSPPDIAMSSLSKREPSLSNSSASEDLENFVSQLKVDEVKTPVASKKIHLDTSFTVENKGFWTGRTVGMLELRRQLEPLSRYWYQIGMGAKISRERLQLLRKVCGQSHEDGLWKMCQLWLEFEPELTWETVLEALRGREMGSLGADVAWKIEKKVSLQGGGVRTSTASDKSITML